MSLKPVLKVKVDELFLRWLGDPDTQVLLRNNIKELIHGEPITRPPPTPPLSTKSAGSGIGKQPQSPRLRPSSPSAPPSHSSASPRSPRPRAIAKVAAGLTTATSSRILPSSFKTTIASNKNINSSSTSPSPITNNAVITPATIDRVGGTLYPGESASHISSSESVTVSRGDGDGESSFLRQKEEELKVRRERATDREKESGAGAAASLTTSAAIVSNTTSVTAGAGSLVEVTSGLPIQRVIAKQRAGDNDVTLTITPSVLSTDVLHIVPQSAIQSTPVIIQAVSTPASTQPSTTVTSAIASSPVTSGSSPAGSSLQKTGAKTLPSPSIATTSTINTTKTQVSAAVKEPTTSPAGTARNMPAKLSTFQQQLALKQQGFAVPRFHFPLGRPSEPEVVEGTNGALLQRCKEVFESLQDGKVTKQSVAQLLKACGLPFYWKQPFYFYCGGDKVGHITLPIFTTKWKELMNECHDEASRFLRITSRSGRNYIEYEDLLPLVQDVVDTHPGLTFLLDAPEFHSRYVQTVISRIFYCVNSSWSERITLPELRKSKLLQTVRLLEVEEDINRITDFFSYEHFYVIYCKFWELDKDHDLLISKEDLGRHNDHAISSRMIDRVFSGAVTRKLVDGKLSYRDFVWFLISEEDKKHPRSMEYWFRCMDLDGDGVISMYEMEFFYEEQVEKMEMLGIETLPFQDCLCQMLDMIRPQEPGKIRLKDLKACALTPIFFDTFFNLDKYLEHEQKDPFASLRDADEADMSDWEKYAAEEYELLVAEEGASDMQQEELMYEDDFEPDEPGSTAIDPQPLKLVSNNLSHPNKKSAPYENSTKKEDIYDFSSSADDLGY